MLIFGSTGSTSLHHPIQWATPPTGGSVDSEGVPMRYRTVFDLLDSTDEVQNMEYSGVCLIAIEEPSSVEEALTKDCWKQAMKAEMQSIEENRT